MPAETPPAARSEQQRPHSLRFRLGLFLMLASFPFGYGGAALAAVVGHATGHAARGLAWGVGIYILSWGMLGLGLGMAGPGGMQRVKEIRRKWLGRRTSQAGPGSE